MSSGLDKLPGHAYAPGFEPGWFDIMVTWKSGSDTNVIMLALLAGTLILLLLVRLIATAPRMKNRGVRGRHVVRPEMPGTRKADLTAIMARTLTDPNFATQPKLRPGQIVDEAES